MGSLRKRWPSSFGSLCHDIGLDRVSFSVEAGEISVNGVDITAMDAAGLRAYRRNTISMVFQRWRRVRNKTVMLSF